MTTAIKNFFLKLLGKHLGVFICSMIPIIELRGSIPLGAALGLPFWLNYLLSVIGNLLPVPIILLFVKAVLTWMRRCRVGIFNKISEWLFKKAEKNRPKIEKYGFWGLFIFVAIPLPGTGAWTGSLVAALFDFKFGKAMLSVTLGVLTAGVVFTLISYGVLGFLSILL
ncbi:MAG: COG2426 family protein [Eubacteriales bacterium]